MGETERSEKSTNTPEKPALSDCRLSAVLFRFERVGAGSYRGAATTADVVNARWKSFREWYRFTGNEDDAEAGLSYHGARYYSPSLKRFISADPVTVHEAGSDINPYSYGYGNPTSYVDPDGREPISIGTIILISVAIGALSGGGVYAYQAHQAGVEFGSAAWFSGFGIAVAAGAVGGLGGGYGGAVLGPMLGGAMGLSAGSLGGMAVSGVVGGTLGAGAGYGTAWGLSAAFSLPTTGYSVGGLLTAMGTGAVVGGAAGAAVWGGNQLWNSLASGADDAAQGAAAGEAAHDAASKAGPPPVSRNILDRADGPGPKPIIKATPKTPVSPKMATAPGPPKKAPTVEEPQPIHDPTKPGEVDPWQTKQLDPDFDASMRETSARLRAAEAAGGGRNNAEQSALIEMAKSDKNWSDSRRCAGVPRSR